MKKYKVISLFTGAGGLDIGLEQTGRFETIACIEKIHPFAQTIRLNRDAGRIGTKRTKVYEADISELDPRQMLEDLSLERGELDLVVGGPPCQAFSTSGRRGTVQDPRGTLLWQFLRFIDHIQPKMFVMENVRGLMSAALRHRQIAERPEKGGTPFAPDEEPGSVIRLFIEDLHNKYRMDCFEVNAVNYGAPQLRERVLFVGNRFNRLCEFPLPTHGGCSEENNEQPFLFIDNEQECELERFRTLGEALEGLIDLEPIIMDFSPRKKKYLALVPPGGNWRCLPDAIAKEAMGKAYYAKGGRSGWWRRLSFDLPAPTILTLPNHAGTALCHPTELRTLTLKECARVQEFPDEWEFVGTPAEQYAQVGNAVPVRLGRVCGNMVAEQLDSIHSDKLRRAKGEHPFFRVVYVKSHIRTRKWFKAGQKFVWQDGEDNSCVAYGPAKTQRKVRAVWET